MNFTGADSTGSEVACRSFGRMLEEWQRAGLSREALVEGSGCSVEQLHDKHARLSWNSYRVIMANARQLWDDDGFVELGRVIMNTPWARPLTIPARLVSSARDLYRWITRPGKGIARQIFTCVRYRLEEAGPNRLVLDAEMKRGYPPCREFFLVTKGTLAALPQIIGLGPSQVDLEWIDQGARYDILMPAGGGALAWLRRSLSWPLSGRATARELEEAHVELHERNQELAARNRELEVQNAELERYAYTVSHDLKSPLVTIRGFLGLLERDALARDAARLKQDIVQINRAVETMARLLDELLELTRVGRIVDPPEEIDLTKLAHEAVNLVGGQIIEGGVVLSIQDEMPTVVGDRPRLLEVLQNLVENAVRFMGDQAEPRIEIGASRQDPEVVCFVKDNGIGIPPAHHERIFGLFHRLDRERNGTGIGLALAKRIVEVHGGRIWVDSTGQGDGTTFFFALPTHAAALGPDADSD